MTTELPPDKNQVCYKRHPFSERKRVVELYQHGLTSTRIAAMMGLDDSMIRSWLRKYKQYGLESLHPYWRAGDSSEKGKRSHNKRKKAELEAYEAYAGSLESLASITRQYGLNYASFRYHLLRYHPELIERRAALKREVWKK